MQKKRLDKLFYSDPKNYVQEYRKRFDDPDTYHLPIQIGEQPAFFYVTPEILRQVAVIERTDKAVAAYEHRLPDQAIIQFILYSMIGEVLQTNRIEGVHSTRKDISTVLQNPDKKQRFHGIIRKYRRLSRDEIIPLETSQDIRNLYDELFSDEIAFMDEIQMLYLDSKKRAKKFTPKKYRKNYRKND